MDIAYTHDGNKDLCEYCGNKQKAGLLYCCDECPHWHYSCIPNGFKKPRLCKCGAAARRAGIAHALMALPGLPGRAMALR